MLMNIQMNMNQKKKTTIAQITLPSDHSVAINRNPTAIPPLRLLDGAGTTPPLVDTKTSQRDDAARITAQGEGEGILPNG
jgi:hypothetical protein